MHPNVGLGGRLRLALLCAETGRLGEAREHLRCCRAIMAADEDWRGVAGSLAAAEAAVALAEGDASGAARFYEAALAVFRRYSLAWEEAAALHTWGRLLLAGGEPDQSTEKFAAAEEIYHRIGAGERWLEQVKASVEPALQQTLPITTPLSPQSSVLSPRPPDGLSVREVEVLRLIAAGKTNLQIAETLVIRLNTVAHHVGNILLKTESANRTEAAAYAHRRLLT